MVTDILNKMAEIVDNTMTSFQSDFEKYDRLYIESDEVKFPMIWIVGKSHTYLLKLGEYKRWFFENESVRFDYIAGNNPFKSYADSTFYNSDHLYFITENDVRRTFTLNALAEIEKCVESAACAWQEEYGKLLKLRKVPVKIENISLTRLKALIEECGEHNNNSLMSCLKRFQQYRRVATDQFITVSYNPGYNEFTFWETINGRVGLVGGIVFHGWPESGYQTNNSVQLTPQYGWATHT